MTKKIIASELSPFGARLRIASALKGLNVEFELPPGGTGSAQIKEMHPWGRTPLLVTGKGATLAESLALLEYLEDSHPGALPLRPQHDPEQLARVRMIPLLFDQNVLTAMAPVYAQLAAATPDVAAVHQALDNVTAQLEKLVFFFDKNGPGAVGEVSIADCAMAPFAFLINNLAKGFGATSPVERVPVFAAWWSRIGALPAVKTVTDDMQAAFVAYMAAKKAQG